MRFPMPSPDHFPPGSMIGTYPVIRPLSAGGNASPFGTGAAASIGKWGLWVAPRRPGWIAPA